MLRKLLVWFMPWALLATAITASADESKDLQEMQKQATRLDTEASGSEGHTAIFASLSKELNVPVATLQNEQKSTNFGFGQLFIANSLATASGKTFDQISQEFKSGKGWGEIAKENNVKVGKVVSALKRTNQQMDQAQQHGGAGASSNQSQQGGNRGHAGMAGPKGKR